MSDERNSLRAIALHDTYEYMRIEQRARRLRDERSARLDGDDTPLMTGELHIGLRRRIRELYGVVVQPNITPNTVSALQCVMQPHVLDDTPRNEVAVQLAAILRADEVA